MKNKRPDTMFTFNSKKYVSFLIALVVFNGMPTSVGKILGVGNSLTYIVFILSSIPLLLLMHKIDYKKLVVPFTFLFILLFNSLDTNNEVFVKNIVQGFVVFGMYPYILASLDFSLQSLKKYLRYMLVGNFIVLLYLLLFRMDIYTNPQLMNYMTFAFWLLPTCLISFYFHVTDKSIFMLCITIISLVILFMFGNRFSTIVAIFSLGMIYIHVIGFNKLLLFLLVFITLFLLIIIDNIDPILSILIDFSTSFDLSNRALIRMQDSLGGDLASISSGRDFIYKITLEAIANNPFGYGPLLGNEYILRETAAPYPHNVFLEIILHFGVLLGSLFIILLSYLVVRILFLKNEGTWVILMTCLLSLPLLTSGSYIVNSTFWLSLSLIFRRNSL
jgi:hypothetical protein